MNKIVLTFFILFFLFYLNKVIKGIIFAKKIQNRFREEIDEVINSDKYKVMGKNEQGLL